MGHGTMGKSPDLSMVVPAMVGACRPPAPHSLHIVGAQSWRDPRALLGPVGVEASRGPGSSPPPGLRQRPRGPTRSAQRALPAHPAPLPRACPAPAQPPGTLSSTAALLGQGPGVPVQLHLGDSCSSWWRGAIRAASSNHGGGFSALCSDPGDSRPEQRGCWEHLPLGSDSARATPGAPSGGAGFRVPAAPGHRHTRLKAAWRWTALSQTGRGWSQCFRSPPGPGPAPEPLTAAHSPGRQSTDLSVRSQGETEAPRPHHEDRASD